MKRILLSLLTIFSTNVFAQSLNELNASRITLPNGWNLTPRGQKPTTWRPSFEFGNQ